MSPLWICQEDINNRDWNHQAACRLQSTSTEGCTIIIQGYKLECMASASALFLKAMDAIIQGIPHVICYTDHVQVTGANDEEHLCNLAKVL